MLQRQSKSDSPSDFMELVLFGNTSLCAISLMRDAAAQYGYRFAL